MSDQMRRIADWTRISAASGDLEDLAKVLEIAKERLQTQVEPLKLASEGGSVEFKRVVATATFRSLEQTKYKSLSAGQMVTLAMDFGILAYVTTIQRMLCDGSLVLRETQSQQPEQFPEEDLDVKDIIKEIENRVREDSEQKARQPVKNILMQISRYTREVQGLREATVRTPQDKRGPIVANFQKTTESIFASIKHNYDQLMADERAALPTTPANILLRHDLTGLVPLFRKQTQLSSEMWSAVNYARDEQYGTRELLLEKVDRSKDYETLLAREYDSYLDLGGTERVAREIALGFRSELEKRIVREIEYFPT